MVMENKSLRLTKPFKGANVMKISQSFHPGHKAIDWVAPYGTPVVAPEKVRIDEVICDCMVGGGPKSIERGFGVRMTGLETGQQYVYWHLWDYLPVWGGDVVERGKIVGFMGNSGNVNVGGHYVPLPERNYEPYKGTHLHQVVYSKRKTSVDPLPLTDLDTEPEYTQVELFAAWAKTLGKLAKLKLR
jgi:murein DD-endopeptidase MepM/ murein hydrolase activator NlpD